MAQLCGHSFLVKNNKILFTARDGGQTLLFESAGGFDGSCNIIFSHRGNKVMSEKELERLLTSFTAEMSRKDNLSNCRE